MTTELRDQLVWYALEACGCATGVAVAETEDGARKLLNGSRFASDPRRYLLAPLAEVKERMALTGCDHEVKP